MRMAGSARPSPVHPVRVYGARPVCGVLGQEAAGAPNAGVTEPW